MKNILFSYFIFFCSIVFAQQKLVRDRFSKLLVFNETLDNADFYYYEGDYETALPFYKELDLRFPNDVFFNYRLGVCYAHSIKETNKAIEYLEKASAIDSSISDLNYRLAQAYYFNNFFDKAYSNSLLYKQKNKYGKYITENNNILISTINAKKYLNNASNYFVFNADSSVNTAYAEYAMIFNKEKKYYTFRGDEKVFDYKIFFNRYLNKVNKLISPRDYKERIAVSIDNKNLILSDLKKNTIKYFFTHLKNNVSNKSKQQYDSYVLDYNTKQLPIMPQRNTHLATVAYYQNNIYVYKDMQRKGSGEIYLLKDGKLKPLKGINTKYWEGSATFFNNGNSVVFSSTRSGGKGGKDLFMATKIGDEMYANIINLNYLNSNYDEDAPFFDESNNTLYFSTNNPAKSIGAYDIFKSNYLNNNFDFAVNMGYPINSINDDIYFVKNDKQYFFTSNRRGGFGSYDIYIAEEFNTKQSITNIITINGNTKADNLKMYVKNPNDGKNYFYGFYSANRFNSNINIPLQSGLLYTAMPVDSKKSEFMSVDTLRLQSIDLVNNTASLVSVDLAFNLNLKVNDFKVNTLTSKIRIDTNSLKTVDSKNSFVEIKSIFFESNSFDISDEQKEYLRLLAADLKKKNIPQIEISGYTDSNGKEEYNLLLSKKRAKAVYDFLIINKAKAGIIKHNGYGISKNYSNAQKNCRMVTINPVWD